MRVRRATITQNMGGAELLAMAFMTASCWRMPDSIAGWKSLSLILLKGGAWNGSVLMCISGLTRGAVAAARAAAVDFAMADGPAAGAVECDLEQAAEASMPAASVPTKRSRYIMLPRPGAD